MRSMRQAAIAGSILSLLVGAHASGLDGDTMNYQYYFPDQATPCCNGVASNGTFVVGPGIEVPNIIGGQGTLDISDHQVTVVFSGGDAFTEDPFNGFVLTQLSANALTTVSLDPATTMTGFSASDVSFNATSIAVNWEGLSAYPGQVLVLDVNAVPEPADFALMLAGLGVIGVAVRRPGHDLKRRVRDRFTRSFVSTAHRERQP